MNLLHYLEPIARKSPLIRHSRHAAAITWNSKVLVVGAAKYKTHPMQKNYSRSPEGIFLHAEIDAIIKVINKHGSDILKECELHVVRITKGGSLSNSTPCEGCQKAINAFNIQKVYHS